MKMKNMGTSRLVESGVLLAVAYILSFVVFVPFPQGGSVTLCSMFPLVILGYKYGLRWGGFCGIVYGALQMIAGFAPPPVQTMGTLLLEIFLDYLFAWGAVGMISGIMSKIFKTAKIGLAMGAFVGIFGRCICSVLSGVLIWGVYAPEEQNVWIYSIIYNGSWALPEMIITAILAYVLGSFSSFKKLLQKN